MMVVMASYRRNVRACPSGRGDYEVATVNLGPNAGLVMVALVGHRCEWIQPDHTGSILRTRLEFAPGVMVTSVPDPLRCSEAAIARTRWESPVAYRRRGTPSRDDSAVADSPPPRAEHRSR